MKLHASSSGTRSITLVKTEPSSLSQSIPVKKEPEEDSNNSVGKIPGVISGQAITIENFNSNTFISRRSPDSTYSDTSKGLPKNHQISINISKRISSHLQLWRWGRWRIRESCRSQLRKPRWRLPLLHGSSQESQAKTRWTHDELHQQRSLLLHHAERVEKESNDGDRKSQVNHLRRVWRDKAWWRAAQALEVLALEVNQLIFALIKFSSGNILQSRG